MKRSLVTIASVAALATAVGTGALVLPGAALGTLTEVGQAPGDIIVYGPSTGASGTSGTTGTSGSTGSTTASGPTGITNPNTAPVAQCPGSPCVAVTKTTGFQVKLGATESITTIPANGSIVAWTITLGAPTAAQTTYFDANEGGAAEAGIAILKPGKHLEYTLVAQSPVVALLNYFGNTAEFPLTTSIPVKKGEIVALTVPTWAPSLALDNASGVPYSRYVSWRASRPKSGCKSTSAQTAQQTLQGVVQYACLYQQARLAYSALLVTTP